MKTRIYLSSPDVGAAERKLLLEAFDSNWIAPLGPMVDAFESGLSDVLGGGSVCALSSGTAALHLALLLLGVGFQDEVWVPTLTFAATANAVTYVGARPTFFDADPATWNLSLDLVEEELLRRRTTGECLPKAIVTVDLYGHPVDYDRLRALVGPYEIPIIQDAAEALGSSYREQRVGLQGDMGVLSFNGNKIITTSGGGALVSKNAQFIEKARKLASQAREPRPYYEHAEIGYNYRLSNLLAAVGLGQLGTLTQKVDKRREIAAEYRKNLADLPALQFLVEPSFARSNYWLTTALVVAPSGSAVRDRIIERLAAHGIEARSTWKPMHLQPVYRQAARVAGVTAEQIFTFGVCLPSGSNLTVEEHAEICAHVRKTLEDEVGSAPKDAG